MEELLEPSKLREIYQRIENLGSLQQYADRVRLLHHRFLEAQLSPDQEVAAVSRRDMLQFAEDAEYLATQYTNPLVIERVDGLPISDVPSRQIVQDALSLAGTLFEFLAQVVEQYESRERLNSPLLAERAFDDVTTEPSQHFFSSLGNALENSQDAQEWDQDEYVEEDEEQEITEGKAPSSWPRIGSSSTLFLKSALCYGLGWYEPRIQVILGRIAVKIPQPTEPVSLSNSKRWAVYLLCQLLSRRLHGVRLLSAQLTLADSTAELRRQLRALLVGQSSTGESSWNSKGFADVLGSFPSRQAAHVETSLSLIDAAQQCAAGFEWGDAEALEQGQKGILRAINAAHSTADYELVWLLHTANDVIAKMWANSPWTRLSGVIDHQDYLSSLVQDGVFTLWQSQIAALEMSSQLAPLNGGYLDERLKRIIVHMPTSAGKTLLAEMAIVRQFFSGNDKINEESTCIYVAPSRALCDQIAHDFSRRLSPLGIGVTSIVSDNEVTDYEGILFKRAGVVIVTPEKLNSLLRQKSLTVLNAKLFVLDELQSISKEMRGWNYEELVSLLLQHPQTQNAKMLFLSAVMPNHLAVQDWVDPASLNDTISELWQPTRTLKGVITFRHDDKRKLQAHIAALRSQDFQSEHVLHGDLIYVRHRADLISPLRIRSVVRSRQALKVEKGKGKEKGRRKVKRNAKSSDGSVQHAVAAAERLACLGPVLVYCPRKADAIRFCTLAIENQVRIPDGGSRSRDEEEEFQEFLDFVEGRLPPHHPLLPALKHRVAFHHGTLPKDLRNEIEIAFRRGWIHILAATSTLVEGVNFPVKTLLLSDYCTGRRYSREQNESLPQHPLSKSDFRNISGRAGRALYETEGQVVFLQSVDEFPYGTFEDAYDDYLNLEPESPELYIRSALQELAHPQVVQDLSRLVAEVDEGTLSNEALLFDLNSGGLSGETPQLVDRLRTFTLLLQDQGLAGEDEESFVHIFQGTFWGQSHREQASHVGMFCHRSGRAARSCLNDEQRSLFAQTGLPPLVCRTLFERVRQFWSITSNPADAQGPTAGRDFQIDTLDLDLLLAVADVVFDVGDASVEPLELRLNEGGRSKQTPQDPKTLFANWILTHDTESLLEQHFAFIKNPTWRAEQFISYTQDAFSYKLPWLLSIFWLFSKAVLARQQAANGDGLLANVDLANTPLGHQFLLLPSYAKFGVNTPAAAFFSTLGVTPAPLARQLGDLYEHENASPGDKHDYRQMLDWLVHIDPRSRQVQEFLQPRAYQSRLAKVMASLRPFQEETSSYVGQRPTRRGPRRNLWERTFYVAGWRYYEGEAILSELVDGQVLLLQRDLENQQDASSVGIYIQSRSVAVPDGRLQRTKLGYVPRYLAREVANRLDDPKVELRAEVQQVYRDNPIFKRLRVRCYIVVTRQ